MILEVQIQIFSGHARQSFYFQKFQGAQILIFFDENWHEASFYNKEQTQNNKFEIWLLKTTILDSWKSAFLVFEENPLKKCFLYVSALIQL